MEAVLMHQGKSGDIRLSRAIRAACAAVALAGAFAGTAGADSIPVVGNGGTLNLSQSFASTAANQTATTVTGTGANDGVAVAGNPLVVGSDISNNGPATTTYVLNQTFTNSAGSYTLGTLSTGDAYGFIQSYVIDVPNSTAGAFIFSLNLTSSNGLDDLSARLYSYGPGVNTTLGITGAPQTGTLYGPWTSAVNGAVSSTTMAGTNVAAGLYVLEIVGQVTSGATSGTYTGQFSVTPVPVPAALPLMVSGLAALAGYVRRRRVTVA